MATSSSRNVAATKSPKKPESPSCMDIVNETIGMSAMEVEEEPHHHHNHGGPPRKAMSNLSLPKKKSPITGACSNLVNSIVGAGIIGIPYALNESGLIAGTILLVAVSCFTVKSLQMLVDMAHFHPRLKGFGVYTYEDLMTVAFGKIGHHFILASMFVTAYGAMVAYLLIVKDTLPVVLGFEDEPGTGSFIERELIMIVTSFAVMLPLSLQRDMSTLAFTSLISVICDTLLVIFIAIFSPVKESVSEAGGIREVLKSSVVEPGFFIGFGVLTTAMTCQHSAFIVSGSLANLTSSRWSTVASWSLSISCILCAILGIAGYLGFLDETQGDILNNFEPDTIQATTARALLAITMFFTYPMEAFVARHVLIKLFFDGDLDDALSQTTTTHLEGDYSNIDDEPQLSSSACGSGNTFCNRRIAWTFYIYLGTLIPALIVDDLGPVLSLTGAIGGCCLAYIGPGLVYLGVNGDEFLSYVGAIVMKRSSNPSTTQSAGDLPLEGTANAQMQTIETGADLASGPKPWWWYPALMPFWVRVASVGSKGSKECLTKLEAEHGPPTGPDMQAETIGPSKLDFYISIFFVAFGFIALAAGITSNVYVQVNAIFYTPT